MMKKLLCAWIALALLLSAACGLGESLFVDNRETDKIYPERLNLRAQPAKNGAILGLYYTGTEVNVLAVENEEYDKVEVGGMTGYMASSYLIPQEEATARYGENSGFGDGRAAEIDLTGMWMTSVPLRETTDDTSTALATLNSNSKVGLLGILDAWAYIWAETDDGRKLGYVPLDVLTDVGNLKVSIISSGKTDKKTILYDAPTAKAKEIMRLSNGTACFTLFGRKEGEWRRVRVGGVSGWIKYTQTGNLYALGDQMRSVVPYYPLLMQTKSDTLLYQQKDDAASRYMTLGQGMYVELLAESDSYAYVRTSAVRARMTAATSASCRLPTSLWRRRARASAWRRRTTAICRSSCWAIQMTKRASSARCAAARRRGLHPTRRRITFRFRSDRWSAM